MPTGMNAPSLGNLKMLGVGEIKELKNLTNETKELSNLSKEAGACGKDIKNISQGKFGEVKNIDKTAENEAKKMVGSKELDGMTGDLEKYKKQLERPTRFCCLIYGETGSQRDGYERSYQPFCGQGRNTERGDRQDDEAKNKVQ
ncbi:MAG: hypothetical protein ACKVOQ_21430 [Cyclobacteriaceae bacterium]